MNHRDSFDPNAPGIIGTVYHVDAAHADTTDAGRGTAERPFRTVAAAGKVAQMGDTVIIHEGVYREEVPLTHNGHRYQPDTLITYRAAPGERVFLRGSDVLEAEWEDLGDGTHHAPLPEALFAEGAYNPYALSCVVDEPEQVRPTEGPSLPPTLGQLHVDGRPLHQLASLQAVRETPDSFAVSADGRSLIAHFGGQRPPHGLVELTMRRRCFRPLFEGEAFIETAGIEVEHAAEPGPLCYGRPLSIRTNPEAGVRVRRTFALPSSVRVCRAMGQPAYVAADDDRIIVSYTDSRGLTRQEQCPIATLTSEDGGFTWNRMDDAATQAEMSLPDHMLDERHGVLLRYHRRYAAYDRDGAYGAREHENVLQTSRDGGVTWSEPEVVDRGAHYYRPVVLANGTLVWPYTDSQFKDRYHSRLHLAIGRWNDADSRYAWEKGGTAEIDPQLSTVGLGEPAACQLPDGRIFIILRCGNVRPTQDRPGVPSVKRYCISEDGGRTLSEPRILTYDDGGYVYSARNYPDVWRRSRTDRVYVIINIAGGPAENCDPRTALHIARLDPETLGIRRDSVAVIENRHPEHHRYVRFSNWSQLEERGSADLLLWMQLHMSEYCPVRSGYDFNCYRYLVSPPD